MAIVGRCRVGAEEQAMFAAKLSKAALAVRRRWSAARLAATATAVIPAGNAGRKLMALHGVPAMRPSDRSLCNWSNICCPASNRLGQPGPGHCGVSALCVAAV